MAWVKISAAFPRKVGRAALREGRMGMRGIGMGGIGPSLFAGLVAGCLEPGQSRRP